VPPSVNITGNMEVGVSMEYKTEACLVSDLCSRVSDLWGAEATSQTEVRCHDQARMDILVRTPATLIGIEVKLSHWNRLLAQAYLHRYCVDLVFVALPAKSVTEERRFEAARFDIGVIAIDNGSTHIVQEAGPAQPSKHLRQRLSELQMGELSLLNNGRMER